MLNLNARKYVDWVLLKIDHAKKRSFNDASLPSLIKKIHGDIAIKKFLRLN